MEVIDAGALTVDDGQRYFRAAGEWPAVPGETVWNNYTVDSMTGGLTLRHSSTQFAREHLREYLSSLPPEGAANLRGDHQLLYTMLMDRYWAE